MPPHTKVIHRVEPYPYEDLTGYLMRVAARNHFLGPAHLHSFITGTSNRPIHFRDLPALAEICRLTAEEACQLSGYERRLDGLDRRWHIHNEWLTKSVFVTLRQAKVCPYCIQESSFIRGEWSLSFYTICAFHNVRLIDKCPDCMRMLQWNRKYPHRCRCGFHLGQQSTAEPLVYEATLSRLIAYRLVGNSDLLKGLPAEDRAIERLAGLSLDGLCKTFWFLGHCLGELGKYGSGHGRKKPEGSQIEQMAERAICLLNNWPNNMGRWLQEVISDNLPTKFSATALEHLLAPVQNYFLTDQPQYEMSFLVAALEQHLKRIWLLMGQRHLHSRFEHQLELEFDSHGD